MSCALACTVIASACIQSSGFEPPPPAENVIAVDGGGPQDFDFTSATVKPDGSEYVDGRRVLLQAGLGQLVIVIQVGSLDAAAQAVEPFGAASVLATDGPDAATSYVGVSGTLTVHADDAAPGSRISVDLTDVTLQQACDGSTRVIAHANITAKAVVETLPDGLVGVGGFFRADEVAGGFYDPFPYIGLAHTTVVNNAQGVPLYDAGTDEACIALNPRPSFHDFAIAVDPGEVPAGGGDINLANAPHTRVLVSEVSPTGATVHFARAVQGTLHVDGDVTLDDGAVMTATLSDLSFRYEAGNTFTNDPPLTVAAATLKAILGKPAP